MNLQGYGKSRLMPLIPTAAQIKARQLTQASKGTQTYSVVMQPKATGGGAVVTSDPCAKLPIPYLRDLCRKAQAKAAAQGKPTIPPVSGVEAPVVTFQQPTTPAPTTPLAIAPKQEPPPAPPPVTSTQAPVPSVVPGIIDEPAKEGAKTVTAVGEAAFNEGGGKVAPTLEATAGAPAGGGAAAEGGGGGGPSMTLVIGLGVAGIALVGLAVWAYRKRGRS